MKCWNRNAVGAVVSVLVLLGCGSGKDGSSGAKGDAGAKGDPGLSSVVKTSSAATSLCPGGGVVIEAGLDANGNGALDAAEVISALTTHVCNGTSATSGTPGLNALVKTTPTASCPSGAGVVIEVGSDANGNGTLDAAEVNAAMTQTVCDGLAGAGGTNGLDSLLKSTADAAACGGLGGQLLESGLDLSRDGVLDPAEVTGSITLCNGANGLDGANGFDTVLRVTELLVGDPACAAGGVLVEGGLDVDRNGVLDPGEENPALTMPICNGQTPGTEPHGIVGITYDPFMIVDATAGDESFLIEVTDANDFSIGLLFDPGLVPEQLRVTIRNLSGGPLGLATWEAPFLLAPWDQPADGSQRTITFEFDALSSSWFEVSRTPADVPAPLPI